LRRQRHYRRLWLVAVHALAVVIGATALVIGGTHWLAMRGGFGGEYTSMPAREAAVVHSPVERILDATVVVLAPDAEGDARNLAMGTGAIVARDEKRAWIVTCSHVAMPYAAVGVWRHARDARPVWVQLSDHREGQAIVRWTAPPPLDVALLELPIEHAPEPVPIAPDASELASASRVTFVPNPYRAGWKVLHGELLRRERHRTPAGAYDLLFTDLPVTHGDSGSGLYDSRGQLVGLNTWTRVGAGPSEGISLPSETMRSLVDAIAAGTIDKLDETVPAPPRE
jgi:S1-C subfamily serine protease